MKSSFVRCFFWEKFRLLTVALAFGIILIPVAISAADGGTCSITGKWTRTDGDDIYTFNADGTATTLHWGSQIHNGVWVGNGRTYTISWEHGPRSGEHYIDYATIAPDCNSYGGVNNFGDHFNTIRINPIPQQPVSASDIIGVWQRIDGADIYTIYSDGRITTALNGQTYTGHWLKKDANFIFDWDIRPSGRKYIDTITLSPDGSSFSGTNNEGYSLNAKKIGMPLSESMTSPTSAPTNPTTIPTSSANAKPPQSQESTNLSPWIIPFLIIIVIAGGTIIYFKKRNRPIQTSPDISSDQKTGSNPLYKYFGILLLLISGVLIVLQILNGSIYGGINGPREFAVDLIMKLMIGGVGWYLYTKSQSKTASRAGKVGTEYKPIGSQGPDSEILQLKNQLLNPGWETFEQAANQLGSFARSSPDKIIPLIPMLIKDLYSMEDRVASGAALALTKIVEKNSEILVPSTNDLIQFLEYTKNHQYEIIGKRATIFILGIVGVKNPDLVIPVVSVYLNDTDEYVQKNARQAVKNLNIPDQSESSSPRMYSGRCWDLLQIYCKRVNEHWNSNNPGFVVLSKDEEKEFITLIKNLEKNEESIQLLIKLHSPPCMKYIDDVQMAAMVKVNEFDIRHLL